MDEVPETISQLAKRLGKTRVTVWNWITKGVAVGTVSVKLNAQKIGAQWTITPEQYLAFVKACNPGRPVLPESPSAQKVRLQREKAAALNYLNS